MCSRRDAALKAPYKPVCQLTSWAGSDNAARFVGTFRAGRVNPPWRARFDDFLATSRSPFFTSCARGGPGARLLRCAPRGAGVEVVQVGRRRGRCRGGVGLPGLALWCWWTLGGRLTQPSEHKRKGRSGSERPCQTLHFTFKAYDRLTPTGLRSHLCPPCVGLTPA